MSSQLNFGALFDSWWGGSYVDASSAWLATSASNLVVPGTNPPYYASDFFAIYPRFGGTPLLPTGAPTTGSVTVTIASPMFSLAAGQVITGPGVQDGTTIASVVSSPASITLSLPATLSASGVAFIVYPAPLVPLPALNILIQLASAQLNQGRWLEMWGTAMNLYVAHLAQLWLTSEGSATTAPGAALTAGLARGIATAKSVGDVSVGYQALAGNDEYVDLNLTVYGQTLIRLCKIVGAGPIFVI